MQFLIVDDEFVALTKMIAMLTPHGICHASTNGKQAFEMYSRALINGQPYDLITLDIDMPSINGLMLLRLIYEREKESRSPLTKKMIISAQSSSKNVIQAFTYNCDVFIVKPVRKEILTGKLIDMGLL